jgi:malate dehydrogenase (oxaloacetate-decarboxylating)(NADP+)
MVKQMADKPIVFAMANPDPEIPYSDAKQARPDAIVASGRSDFPNQVNNVLGFPFIFRGALDVEASEINEEMKMAAAKALANLAKEEVPDSVKQAYDGTSISFGPEYIIPKPFDPRVLVWTASAVAEAAMKTGVARKKIDIEGYKESLRQKIDWSRGFMRNIYRSATKNPKRIVFPEGDHPKIIWAATELVREGFAKPILLTKNKEALLKQFDELNHSTEGIEIVVPRLWNQLEEYIDEYFRLHQRKGKTRSASAQIMRNYFYFATMMVQKGDADGMVGGVSVSYPEVLRPALKIVGPKKGTKLVAGMYMLRHERKNYFFADAAVNINPNAEQIAEITLTAADEMERMGIEPRVALLSFSNFGSVRCPETEKMTQAVEMIRERRSDLPVDGPIQPDMALNLEMLGEIFPFADIRSQPNLLIFPNLDAGNISLRLVSSMSDANYIGPIIIGLAKPVHLLQRGSDVTNIVNLAAIATVDAQQLGES